MGTNETQWLVHHDDLAAHCKSQHQIEVLAPSLTRVKTTHVRDQIAIRDNRRHGHLISWIQYQWFEDPALRQDEMLQGFVEDWTAMFVDAPATGIAPPSIGPVVVRVNLLL
jgi:hypothetical protein